MQLIVNHPVPGIDAAIAYHLVMLFGYVLYQTFYEIHNRNGFFHILPVFVAVVVESDKVTIIFVNPGGGDDGTPKIASNVLNGCSGVASVGSGIDIEAVFMLPVASCLG